MSEFLRNLQNNSRVLERPELIEIKVAGAGPQGINRRVFEFSLNFSLKQTPERALMQAAQPGARVGVGADQPRAYRRAIDAEHYVVFCACTGSARNQVGTRNQWQPVVVWHHSFKA